MTAQRFDAGALTNFYDGTAVGDFNNDGKLDVLAFDSIGLGNAYLTLGNGDGSFQPPTQVSTEPLGDVVVGDFNHDGNLDFACADQDNITNVSIAVYLGKGDGTFQAPMQMVEPFNFGSMVAGDFNGDGKLDLALSAEPLGVTTVYIFQGNGDGTFQNPVLTPITDVTHGVTLTATDLNHDGKADLVALRAWTPSTTIDILLSNGDGTLRETMSMKLGEELAGAAVGDLNGDGIPDLVVADHTDQVSPSGYWRLQGKGDGTFQTPVFTPTTFVTSAAMLRDLNGDGKLDLVMFDLTESSKFTISLGDGQGAFTEAASYTDAPGSYSGALGDFNGDGKVDIVMATWPLKTPTGIFSASLVLGNGDGTFRAERVFTEAPLPPFATPFGSSAVGLGDFNGDGNLDAVVAATSNTSSLVNLQRGNGDGTFGAPYESLTLGQPGVSLVVADFNHDSRPDFALLDYVGNVYVSVNRGDGTFPELSSVFADRSATSFVEGDFNGDGIPDLAVGTTDSGVAVLLGKGDGTFQNPVSFAAGVHLDKIVVADFNGDGKLDIVAVNGPDSNLSLPSAINILLGNGNGTFQAPVRYSYGTTNFQQAPEDLVAGDFNEDGRPDLFITTKDTAGNAVPSTVLINDGTGAFQMVAGPTISGSGMVAADFNNDGHLDIAVVSGGILNGPAQAQLDGLVLYGKGDGTFQDAFITAMGSEPTGPAVGDINNSGLSSIVVGQRNGFTLNTPDASIGVVLNTGTHYQLSMPLHAAVGVPVSLVITALDAFGNVVTGYAGTLHFTSSDQNAMLPANYTFTPADKGEHGFTVTFNSFGSQSITAVDTAHSGITGTQSGIFVLSTIHPPPAQLSPFANTITHSQEHYAQFVTNAYQQYLGRKPDDAGLGAWVAKMQAGLTDEQLEANFIGSAEYIVNHGGSGAGWVQGLYHDILGRTPAQSEVNFWVSQLQSGVSPQTVALGFAASREREGNRVRADYLTFLGRTPAQAEVSSWVNNFANGLSNEGLLAGFLGSSEYYNNPAKGKGDNLDWIDSATQDELARAASADEIHNALRTLTPANLAAVAAQITHAIDHYFQFVTNAYQQYLGRNPDPAGLSAWAARMQAGLTDEHLEAAFIGAPEYIAKHGGAGAGWVQGLYQDILGRTPLQTEVDFWVSQLQSGMSPQTVALGFAASREREGNRVRADYQTFLGRTALQSEVTFWVNRFAQGFTNEDLTAGFLGSVEYFNAPAKGKSDKADWVLSAVLDELQRSATTAEFGSLEGMLQ